VVIDQVPGEPDQVGVVSREDGHHTAVLVGGQVRGVGVLRFWLSGQHNLDAGDLAGRTCHDCSDV
jgi:hypothetical protein